jgi:alkaline phosphatase
MQYEADRLRVEGGVNEPSLAQMVTAAIARLSQDPKGFVLMVEGGRIDHAHHGGNAARALEDFKAFEEAIAAAVAATDSADTLVLVTADHSHVFTIAGYQPRNHPILGKVPSGPYTQTADGKPYTTLGYANGPGATSNEPRADISDVDTTALNYQQQATVPTRGETHGGEDVVIKADGPRAHLFRGTIEQNVIFHLAKYALGL